MVKGTSTAILLFAMVAALSSCENKAIYATPSLPDTVLFHRDIMPVFTAYCLGTGCHEGSSAAADLDLSADSIAYYDLYKKGDIDTAVPAQSFLYQTMNTTATPMPPSGKLNDYDVNLVLKWLQQGARRN